MSRHFVQRLIKVVFESCRLGFLEVGPFGNKPLHSLDPFTTVDSARNPTLRSETIYSIFGSGGWQGGGYLPWP